MPRNFELRLLWYLAQSTFFMGTLYNRSIRSSKYGKINISIFLDAGRWSCFLLRVWFSSKLVSTMNYKKMDSTWRNFKKNFFIICTWPNGTVRAKNLPIFQFGGKTDVWISHVRHVKYWYYGKYSRWLKLHQHIFPS